MHGKQLQHSIKYIHTYKYVKLYVYLYVVGKLADTHTHTQRNLHTHTDDTRGTQISSVLFTRICARLCRLCASCNWKWASARYAPPPLVVPLFPFPLLTTNRLCQICAAVVFFTFWRFVRFFTYFSFFLFFKRLCSHCAATELRSQLRQLFSVQPPHEQPCDPCV